MNIFILISFLFGYLAIIFEQQLKIDKAATALLTGVLCWTIFALSGEATPAQLEHVLLTQMGDISGILFFLLGAMTIVELMDSHRAFDLVSDIISTKSKAALVAQIGMLTFCISSILDNLTTAIIMTTLMGKLVPDRNFRFLLVGLIIIASNAGGAWSPIGDVTTTMLWVGQQISTLAIIKSLFLPALVCLFVPMGIIMLQARGPLVVNALSKTKIDDGVSLTEQRFMLFAGFGTLMFVPVFKTLTHLPPFFGMMLGLAFLWIATSFINQNKSLEVAREKSVYHALERIDTPTILFFLGILLSVGALQSAGILLQTAAWLDNSLQSPTWVGTIIGFASAIVDNVPLVAAATKMYTLEVYPQDHYFWKLLAYTAGTGGSMLIIGSAAGVAAMGIEKISFVEYFKKISWLALLGYVAGLVVYVLLQA